VLVGSGTVFRERGLRRRSRTVYQDFADEEHLFAEHGDAAFFGKQLGDFLDGFAERRERTLGEEECELKAQDQLIEPAGSEVGIRVRWVSRVRAGRGFCGGLAEWVFGFDGARVELLD
jgi:hypothetical protein